MSDKEQLRISDIRNLPPVISFLLIANILAFAATVILRQYWNVNVFDEFALFHPESEKFSIYQMLTHLFLHGGFFHIFINMFVLWMFGRMLENVWGGGKFLLYYLFTGLGAAALHLAVSTFTLGNLEEEVHAYLNDPEYEAYQEFSEEHFTALPPAFMKQVKKVDEAYAENPESSQAIMQSKEVVRTYFQKFRSRPTVGASGAVFGVLLAFGLLFPNLPVLLFFLFPMKAKYFVIMIGIAELILGFSNQYSNIANFAHIGGMLFGYLLLQVWGYKEVKINFPGQNKRRDPNHLPE